MGHCVRHVGCTQYVQGVSLVLRKAYVPIICLGLLGYFAYHLFVGDHGLEASARLNNQVSALEGELAGLEAMRLRLDRDVALLRSGKLDPDMLDERARTILNFSHPDEVVIFDKSRSSPRK